MTRDDIIRMAREAGFENVRGGLTDTGEISDYWDCWPGQLVRFAALVASHEREACAKTAEKMLRFYTQAVTGVPEAIRARGNT